MVGLGLRGLLLADTINGCGPTDPERNGRQVKAGTFFGELKRRNVLRAGAIYIAAVWALAQGISQLSAPFGMPNWVTRWFVIACAIGFPFWIAFAWVYELTPTGLKRESEIAPEESITAHTGKRFDRWIFAVMAVAIILLVTNTFVLHRDVTSTANAASAKTIAAELAKVPQKSVAVLPLANESGNPKQQYFVDGMSEELISDLTQINGLKVIGKYSSFKFRNTKESPAQIGAALGVTHLIQGSVFQEGESIRVTISLIRAKDGSSVWSHSYDEPLKNVFAIQTQIGHAVAAALKVQLLGQTLGIDDKPPSGNVNAYRLMLQGRELTRHETEAGLRQGISLLQQALKLDPDYAYAWGEMSSAWLDLGHFYPAGDAQQQAWAQARMAVDREQALAPESAAIHLNRGAVLAVLDNDPVASLAEIKRAYAMAPNDGDVTDFLSGGLIVAGQLQPAIALERKAITTNPLRTDLYVGLSQALMAQGQFDGAEQAVHEALALQPDFPGLYVRLTEIDILRGDIAGARRHANQVNYRDAKLWALAAVAQIAPNRKKADADLQAYITKYRKIHPYQIAELYAMRKQPDEMFEWLQRVWTQRHPFFFHSLLSDPFVLPYQHDPRFTALCEQAGLPLPGQVLPATVSSSVH